jgi:hypothetical protein
MKKISLQLSALVGSLLIPAITFAQNSGGGITAGQNFKEILVQFGNILNIGIGFLVTAAIAVFFWGLVMYIFKLGSAKGAEEGKGKSLMIYGIVALFVMVSVWGILGFMGSFFGLSNAEKTTDTLIPNNTINPNKNFR